MKQDTPKLVRPVCCARCGEKMFYSGDQRHEPEVRVLYEAPSDQGTVYVHVRCWNAFFEKP